MDPNRSPQIASLKIDPSVVCVGARAEISFDLADPNQDAVTWNAKLNTLVHGDLETKTGTAASGTHVTIGFKAAKTGFHRHRVGIKVEAIDPSGAAATPAELNFFVFTFC